MRSHRFKLGERVVVFPGEADAMATVVELITYLDPHWACSQCDTACDGPFYKVDAIDARGRWVDVVAQHDLRPIPNPNPTKETPR